MLIDVAVAGSRVVVDALYLECCLTLIAVARFEQLFAARVRAFIFSGRLRRITRVWPCQWLSRNSANERASQTELQGVAKNKATLVIAHRLSTVVDARSPSGFQSALSANVGAAEVGGVGFWVYW